MLAKWKSRAMDAQYNSVSDEEMCDGIRQLCYCRVDGVESLLTVIGDSICLEKVVEEKSGMTSCTRRVTIAGSKNSSGYKDGPGLQARFNLISDICVDSDNMVIICDYQNRCVRMMDLIFPFTVVTMCGRPGSFNAELSEMRFDFVSNVCVDALNNIYLCENHGDRISKIDSRRETIVTFFDNSMVNDLYYGDKDLKKYCVLSLPTTILIQDNRNLIILNNIKNSLCKVSLYPTKVEGKRWCSVVKYNLNFNCTIAVDKRGDIIVCERQLAGVLAFYKILGNGQEIHIADKGPSNIRAVMQVVLRQQDNCDRLCFFTIEHDLARSTHKIVQTRMNMKWDMVRILFLACFKPEPDHAEYALKTFELLPVIGKSGKYSPILKMIIDFVNTLF